MRKVNKILMATVSILLCLVLISTSVVSGIFAKFAINNKGKATASLKAFGVTLDMTVDDETLEDAGADVETAEDFYKVTKSVTITGLKMAPGLDLEKIINIKLTGTPTVNCRFKLDIDFDFDTEKFIIPYGVPGVSGSNGQLYFPLYFAFGRFHNNNEKYRTFYYSFTSNDGIIGEHEVELYEGLMLDFPYQNIDSAIYFDGIGGSYIESEKKYVDSHLYRDFAAGEEIFLHPSKFVRPDEDNMTFIYEPDESLSFNNFDLGFLWFSDDADPEADKYNGFDTYIMNHNPDGLGFTYKVTVSVEQIT